MSAEAIGDLSPEAGDFKGHCEAVGRNYDEIIKSTSLDMLLLEDGADRCP
jgi:hypothetical protein